MLLKKQTMVPHIIVVDDCPEGNDHEKLLADFREITLIKNEKNLGCGGSLAEGIAAALKENYDTLILSDNDATPVSPNLIERLVDKINADKRLGFVVPNNSSSPIISPYKEEKCSGWMFHYFTTRKDVIRRVGVPEKKYFIQIDDADFSKKIISQGYRGVRLGDLWYDHPHKPETYLSPSFVYYTLRNSFYYNRIWMGVGEKIRADLRVLLKATSILAFCETFDLPHLKKTVLMSLSDYRRSIFGKAKKMPQQNLSSDKFPISSFKKPGELYLYPLRHGGVLQKLRFVSRFVKSLFLALGAFLPSKKRT